MLWATHRDWTASEVANALVRSATPLGKGAPSRNWGYGRLDVSRALRTRLLPDSHEPNDWVAAALLQRPLRPGSVVVASLGWADDKVDAYTVDVPAGRGQAVLQRGGQGLTMQRAAGPRRRRQARGRRRARARAPRRSPLPAGRSLLVVARSQGQGPYKLALSGVSGASGASPGERPGGLGRRGAPARRPPRDGAAEQHDVAHQVEPHEQHGGASEGLQRGQALDRAHVERAATRT